MPDVLTLYRPTGLKEYQLIEEHGVFPPRLDHQPIFYPVLNEDYAVEIANKWNTKDKVSGYVGIVTRFDVDAGYAGRFNREVVGNSTHEELWVPARELDEFNAHIIGEIEVAQVFYGSEYAGPVIRCD